MRARKRGQSEEESIENSSEEDSESSEESEEDDESSEESDKTENSEEGNIMENSNEGTGKEKQDEYNIRSEINNKEEDATALGYRFFAIPPRSFFGNTRYSNENKGTNLEDRDSDVSGTSIEIEESEFASSLNKSNSIHGDKNEVHSNYDGDSPDSEKEGVDKPKDNANTQSEVQYLRESFFSLPYNFLAQRKSKDETKDKNLQAHQVEEYLKLTKSNDYDITRVQNIQLFTNKTKKRLNFSDLGANNSEILRIKETEILQKKDKIISENIDIDSGLHVGGSNVGIVVVNTKNKQSEVENILEDNYSKSSFQNNKKTIIDYREEIKSDFETDSDTEDETMKQSIRKQIDDGDDGETVTENEAIEQGGEDLNSKFESSELVSENECNSTENEDFPDVVNKTSKKIHKNKCVRS